MADRFDSLSEEHIGFIRRQAIYFIGTAAADGFVNVSPKGMDTFRVLDATRIAWLNLTGSGNETAAHVLENPRMTVMFCAFEKQPLILRLYGQARVIHPRDEDWQQQLEHFPVQAGARQIFELSLEMVQTSCGFAVPCYDFVGMRPTLDKWAVNKGQQGIEQYWLEKNTTSLNGKPTGING
ncbi:MAG: pyridoxamine 5'-phosphate oxidase family protein [Pseudomonadales bacterium]|nr:pyridoxamine 5'-phosphate oxidase family protein [Pseudomonadales bacterium]